MWKELLYFSKSERKGLAVLICLIIIGVIIRWILLPIYIENSHKNECDLSTSDKKIIADLQFEQNFDKIDWTSSSYLQDSLLADKDEILQAKKLSQDNDLSFMVEIYMICKNHPSAFNKTTQKSINKRITAKIQDMQLSIDKNRESTDEECSTYPFTKAEIEELPLTWEEKEFLYKIQDKTVLLSKLYVFCHKHRRIKTFRNFDKAVQKELLKEIKENRIY